MDPLLLGGLALLVGLTRGAGRHGLAAHHGRAGRGGLPDGDGPRAGRALPRHDGERLSHALAVSLLDQVRDGPTQELVLLGLDQFEHCSVDPEQRPVGPDRRRANGRGLMGSPHPRGNTCRIRPAIACISITAPPPWTHFIRRCRPKPMPCCVKKATAPATGRPVNFRAPSTAKTPGARAWIFRCNSCSASGPDPHVQSESGHSSAADI